MKFFAAIKRAARGAKIRLSKDWNPDNYIYYRGSVLTIRYHNINKDIILDAIPDVYYSRNDWEVIKGPPKPPKELDYVSIYAAPGTEILYKPTRDEHIGYCGDDNSKGELKIGKRYTIDYIKYGGSWSYVKLVGLIGHYNLVNFRMPRRKRNKKNGSSK